MAVRFASHEDQVFAGENDMAADEEDLPATYLYFAVAAIVVIAVTAVGAFILLIRN